MKIWFLVTTWKETKIMLICSSTWLDMVWIIVQMKWLLQNQNKRIMLELVQKKWVFPKNFLEGAVSACIFCLHVDVWSCWEIVINSIIQLTDTFTIFLASIPSRNIFDARLLSASLPSLPPELCKRSKEIVFWLSA